MLFVLGETFDNFINTAQVSAAEITITTQPASSTTVAEGNINGTLTVAATVDPTGETLHYHWHSSYTNNNIASTPITNPTFTIPTNLTQGTYYYFCQIRAGGGVANSSVATVVVIAATIGNVTVSGTTGTALTTPQTATRSQTKR